MLPPVIRSVIEKYKLNKRRYGKRSKVDELLLLSNLADEIRATNPGYVNRPEDWNEVNTVFGKLGGQPTDLTGISLGRPYDNPQIRQRLHELRTIMQSIKELSDKHIISLDDHLDQQLHAYFVTFPFVR